MSAFTTIARSFRGGLAPRPARGYILPRDGFDGDNALPEQQRSFQYFPATISDSQATNYQTKIIPGLSHPLYQWTSGGARVVSFEAIFTRDRTYTSAEARAVQGRSGLGGGQSNGLGNIGVSSNSDPRNVDIPSAITWLRSFLLPWYSDDGKGTYSSTPNRPHPPRKLILGLPGVRLNWGVPTMPSEQMNAIMTSCEVVYDGFFHDGTPRMAKVSLAFAEIIQVGGRITCHNAENKNILGLSGYTLDDKSKGT
jgi:hypothetical protein